MAGNFDSRLRINFKISICSPPMCYMRGGASRAHKRDDLYQIWSELEYRLPAFIVWLYYASSSTMWWFLDNFFFCLVCDLLEKPKNFNNVVHGGTWGHNFYIGTQNGSKQEYLGQSNRFDLKEF